MGTGVSGHCSGARRRPAGPVFRVLGCRRGGDLSMATAGSGRASSNAICTLARCHRAWRAALCTAEGRSRPGTRGLPRLARALPVLLARPPVLPGRPRPPLLGRRPACRHARPLPLAGADHQRRPQGQGARCGRGTSPGGMLTLVCRILLYKQRCTYFQLQAQKSPASCC